jgi:hypothetical protein
MSAPVPAFTGDLHPTVLGTFGLALDISLFEPPSTSSVFTSLHFSSTGSAAITLDWQPDLQQWRFASGIGVIDPVPEPATGFLLSTSSALVLVWRRIRERRHAA